MSKIEDTKVSSLLKTILHTDEKFTKVSNNFDILSYEITNASNKIQKFSDSVESINYKLINETQNNQPILKGKKFEQRERINLDFSGEFGNEKWLAYNAATLPLILSGASASLSLHDYLKGSYESEKFFNVKDPNNLLKDYPTLNLIKDFANIALGMYTIPIEYVIRKGNQQQEERMRVPHYDENTRTITLDNNKENNSFQWPVKNTFSSSQSLQNVVEFYKQLEFYEKNPSLVNPKENRIALGKSVNVDLREANHAIGPSEKNKQNKRYKKKVYKKSKPKTTADEDFGDDFLNKTYNTTKFALELGNAKFDKSKLLIESINFENAYLEAFNKEIDYKKEIGILQGELAKLEGDDLETKKKQLGIQSEITALKNEEISKFLNSGADNLTNLELKKGSESEMKAEISKILDGIKEYLKSPEISKRRENELLQQKQYYEKKYASFDARKAGGIDEERVKPKASQKPLDKKEQSPYEIFKSGLGVAQQLGGALKNLMTTLNIGAHTFVGKVINGFNTALGVMQAIMQVIEAIQAVGTFFKFLGLAEGGVVPGTGSGDTVPAMLTPGEFVVNKNSVSKVGLDFLKWVNNGTSHSKFADRFSSGGLVQQAAYVGQPTSLNQSVRFEVSSTKIKGDDIYLQWRRVNTRESKRAR